MKPGEIQFLYNYKDWANKRVLTQVELITPQEFNKPLDFPHGGVRTTLVHLLSAEWIWRARIQQGVSPSAPLVADDFPTLSAISSRWEKEAGQMREYLDGLLEADLDGKILYRRTDGSAQENILWQILIHVINHGTTHRSEVAAMLTTFNHSPGDLDLTVYLRSLKA